MNKKGVALALVLLALTSCERVGDTLQPKINYTLQEQYLKHLPSAFPPPSLEEQKEDWEKEERIAKGFAGELDLYQAITAFKRAAFLNPPPERKIELEYDIVLCYYLGKKHPELLATFECSPLRTQGPKFPAFQDLLVILYDSYREMKEEERADSVLQTLGRINPELAGKLHLSTLLLEGEVSTLEKLNPQPAAVQEILKKYRLEKKSPATAQWLNAVLPGAGYFYLGQIESGFTATILNGLFIWAAINFFNHGHTAAGIITTSFEAGWYFGGIYGAGLEAKFYNERIYEKVATPVMNEQKLFPVFMLSHAF